MSSIEPAKPFNGNSPTSTSPLKIHSKDVLKPDQQTTTSRHLQSGNIPPKQDGNGDTITSTNKDIPRKSLSIETNVGNTQNTKAVHTASRPRSQTLPYTVARRDTIESIAIKYGVTTSELAKLNKMASRMIFPGQIIQVPQASNPVVSFSQEQQASVVQSTIAPTLPVKSESDTRTLDQDLKTKADIILAISKSGELSRSSSLTCPKSSPKALTKSQSEIKSHSPATSNDYSKIFDRITEKQQLADNIFTYLKLAADSNSREGEIPTSHPLLPVTDEIREEEHDPLIQNFAKLRSLYLSLPANPCIRSSNTDNKNGTHTVVTGTLLMTPNTIMFDSDCYTNMLCNANTTTSKRSSHGAAIKAFAEPEASPLSFAIPFDQIACITTYDHMVELTGEGNVENIRGLALVCIDAQSAYNKNHIVQDMLFQTATKPGVDEFKLIKKPASSASNSNQTTSIKKHYGTTNITLKEYIIGHPELRDSLLYEEESGFQTISIDSVSANSDCVLLCLYPRSSWTFTSVPNSVDKHNNDIEPTLNNQLRNPNLPGPLFFCILNTEWLKVQTFLQRFKVETKEGTVRYQIPTPAYQKKVEELSTSFTHSPTPDPDMPALLGGKSDILNTDQLIQLNKILPARAIGYFWILAYSTMKHGYSLQTMYRKMNSAHVDNDSPVLVVIRDKNSQIFGALASCPLKLSEHFYGTGETFLYTFYPKFQVFKWTGENSYFIQGNPDSIAFGAGKGQYGIWLDADFYRGRTHSCETFANPGPLGKTEDFIIDKIEMWWFGDAIKTLKK